MSLFHDLKKLRKKTLKVAQRSTSQPPSALKRLSIVGIELVVGFFLAFLACWYLGHLLTFSPFWRVILGIILASLVNALTLYKAYKSIKK